jgi:hypothetical protein
VQFDKSDIGDDIMIASNRLISELKFSSSLLGVLIVKG